MQVKGEYQEVTFADSTLALHRGDYDVFVSSLTYTVPRAVSAAYTSPPLWQRGSLALIHKDNVGRFKTAPDLNSPNVTIAVNTGTSAEAQQRRLFPKAKVLATTGQILTATEPVRTKRADAWLNGENDVVVFAKKNASWAAVLDEEHPFDKAPNTWMMRYGDPAWEAFIGGFCAERLERLRGRSLLGVLLRRPGAGAARLVADHRSGGEAAVVRRALDVDDHVRHGATRAREPLLQLRLVVDMRVDCVLDPWLERGHDRVFDLLEPVLEEERGERRLEHRREHVPVLHESFGLVGREPDRRRAQPLAELELARDDGAARTRHDV